MRRFSTSLFFAGGLYAIAPSAIAVQPPLTACASPTPPFVLMQNEIGVGGFSVELVQFVARSLKRSAEIKNLPWARCLNEVLAGHIDIAIDAYDDDERRKKFRYSIPYHELTPQVFYRKGSFVNVFPASSVAQLRTR